MRWLSEYGCTQAWLAEQLGVSRQRVWGYLHGHRRPCIERITHIEALTGIASRLWCEPIQTLESN